MHAVTQGSMTQLSIDATEMLQIYLEVFLEVFSVLLLSEEHSVPFILQYLDTVML